MHILKVHTVSSHQENTFDVRWTNTQMRPRGLIRVKVSAKIEDRAVAAELCALKHLLEHKEVLGCNLAGARDIYLVVSLGAIRKLQRGQSDKAYLAPYANFLTTRFAGCQITVDKDIRWFDGIPPETIEPLLITGPQRETLTVTGVGEIAVTQHALKRYVERFLPDSDQTNAMREGWKRLRQLASDPSVREVSRESLWAGVNAQNRGTREGRYFLNSKSNLVMIVADDSRGEKQLRTVYPMTRQFREQPKAA